MVPKTSVILDLARFLHFCFIFSGYILLVILFWIIFICFYSLSFRFVRDSVVGWLQGGGWVKPCRLIIIIRLSLSLRCLTH